MFQGSNMGEIIEKMFAHKKTQYENPAFANSRFVFNQVILYLDINFHNLKLTRGISYLTLPD